MALELVLLLLKATDKKICRVMKTILATAGFAMVM